MNANASSTEQIREQKTLQSTFPKTGERSNALSPNLAKNNRDQNVDQFPGSGLIPKTSLNRFKHTKETFL